MALGWPATLPKTLLIDGYTESPGDNLIRKTMSVGPPKVRRRSTAAPRPVTGKMVLTANQVAALDTFYEKDLAGGALSFDLAHPRTGILKTWMFAAPPTYTPAAGNHWSVTLTLEIQP